MRHSRLLVVGVKTTLIQAFGSVPLATTKPLGAAGPTRSRRTPNAGALLPDRLGPHAPESAARTEYQNVLPASVTIEGDPAPLSRKLDVGRPFVWRTTPTKLLLG